MSDWTITYGGVEKNLAAWGVCADVQGYFASKEMDTVTLRTIEAFDPDTPQFAWDQPLIIRRDRGEAGAYTGGTIWFNGFVGDIIHSADGARQGIGYKINGPWWRMQRLVFKQSRQVWNGFNTPGVPGSGNAFKTAFLAETFLGESLTEDYYTGTQSITEILLWVNECWNPTKRGAVSGRDNTKDLIAIGAVDCSIVFPKTRAQMVSCAEAILQILRYFPTVVVWFDYTTTIPTLYMRDVMNPPTGYAPTTVPLDLIGGPPKTVKITPRNERKYNGVEIAYKQANVENNLAFNLVYKDVYPPDVTDYTPDVLPYVVELAGEHITEVKGTVAVIPLADALATSGGTAGDGASLRAAFWAAIDSTLQDPQIDPASIKCAVPMSVKDKSEVDVDVSAFPYILAPKCELYEWMGFNWVEATIIVQTDYSRYDDPGTFKKLNATATRFLAHRVILTDCPGGTFTATSSSDSGEGVPPLYPAGGSLAYALYTSLSKLQYEGEISFVAPALPSNISVGNLLSITGPKNTYTGMVVQSISSRPHFGEMTVVFGPTPRLAASSLIELWRATRWRTLYNMPSGRSSGVATPDASTDSTGTAHMQNTTHSLPSYKSMVVTGS